MIQSYLRWGRFAALYGLLSLPLSTYAQTDVTQPGDPTIASSDDSPGSEGVANAIDNQPTKYLNFDSGTNNDNIPSGLVVSPSVGRTLVTGITIQSANDAPDRDIKHFTLEGSNDEAPGWDSGAWQMIYENAEVPNWTETFPDDHRFQTQSFSFDNDKPFLHYRWTVVATQEDSGCCMQLAELELLGTVTASDILQPGDPAIASSDDSPGSEGVANAFDNQPTKYLNFDSGTNNDDIPSGFVVTPSVGLTRISGVTLQSANDAPDRDILSFTIEGSNDAAPGWDSGNWEEIYKNENVPSWTVTFPDDHRFKTQGFTFANSKPFKHYRWTVLETQEDSGCCMQIAEVELLGEVLPGDVTQPTDAIIASSDDSPGSEGVANAIDNQPTKYLNFDRGTNNDNIDAGLVVTPGVGATVLFGMTIQSANDAPDRDIKWILLEGSNDEAPAWDSGTWETIYENDDIPAWTVLFPDDHRFQTQTFVLITRFRTDTIVGQ